MRSLTRTTLICILCISIFACKSKKGTPTSSANTTQAQNTTPSSTVPAIQPNPPAAAPLTASQGGTTIRYVVSFISEGEGIDLKMQAEFIQFANSYPKKITYETKRQGREGETEYRLPLNELSAPEQTEFIKKSNELLSKSRLVTTKENVKVDQSNIPAPPNANLTDDTYRLTVSFISEGEGIDVKNKEEFEKMLNSYPKKIAYEPIRLGREGETYYCLKLNELSASEQMDLIRKTKELLSKSKLVHVDENTKCVHKH